MNPKSLFVLLAGIISFIWLLNPPGLNIDDTIPLFGNLDEAAAALVLINCLAYFGLDLTRFFKSSASASSQSSAGRQSVVEVESEVVPPVR